MNKVSVTIIAFNEAENIEDCLKSVQWADEIIVVDSGSPDATIEISKNIPIKFLQQVGRICETKIFCAFTRK